RHARTSTDRQRLESLKTDPCALRLRWRVKRKVRSFSRQCVSLPATLVTASKLATSSTGGPTTQISKRHFHSLPQTRLRLTTGTSEPSNAVITTNGSLKCRRISGSISPIEREHSA